MKNNKQLGSILGLLFVGLLSLPASADTSFLVTNPSLGDGVLVSASSNQNGMCKALGYEKAAVGSVVSDCKISSGISQVIINDDGSITQGDCGADVCRIAQLICLNGVTRASDQTHLIVKPTHAQSKAPYSATSDQNGVCVSLGYDHAAVGSMIMDCRIVNNLSQVVVDASGSVVSGDLGQDVCRVEQLVCVSKL